MKEFSGKGLTWHVTPQARDQRKIRGRRNGIARSIVCENSREIERRSEGGGREAEWEGARAEGLFRLPRGLRGYFRRKIWIL